MFSQTNSFKVISTCQHIKVRLAGNQGIVLPVAALLKQYKEHPESSMMRHFDLMFIQQSIGKLSSSVSRTQTCTKKMAHNL
jgi:proteasome component ECM29